MSNLTRFDKFQHEYRQATKWRLIEHFYAYIGEPKTPLIFDDRTKLLLLSYERINDTRNSAEIDAAHTYIKIPMICDTKWHRDVDYIRLHDFSGLTFNPDWADLLNLCAGIFDRSLLKYFIQYQAKYSQFSYKVSVPRNISNIQSIPITNALYWSAGNSSSDSEFPEYVAYWKEFASYRDKFRFTELNGHSIDDMIKNVIEGRMIIHWDVLMRLCNWDHRDTLFANSVINYLLDLRFGDCHPNDVYFEIMDANKWNADGEYGMLVCNLLNKDRSVDYEHIIDIDTTVHSLHLKMNLRAYNATPQLYEHTSHYGLVITSYTDYLTQRCQHAFNKPCFTNGCIFASDHDGCVPRNSAGIADAHHETYAQSVQLLRCIVKMRSRELCHTSRIILAHKTSNMRQKLLMKMILRVILPLYWAAPDEIERAIERFSARIV